MMSAAFGSKPKNTNFFEIFGICAYRENFILVVYIVELDHLYEEYLFIFGF